MQKKYKYLSIIGLAIGVTLFFSFRASSSSAINENGDAETAGSEKTFVNKVSSFFKSEGVIEELAPADYKAWCENEENNLVLTKKIADMEYSAFYKPKNYIAVSEFGDNIIDKEKLNKKLEALGDMEYFSFRIKSLTESTELLKVKLNNEGEYYSRIEYFSFAMQNDFKLLDNTDTLDCLLYHFERVYGLAPYATFVLGFPKRTNNADLKILFNDKVFNNGNIIMSVDKNTLEHLPKLKL